MPPALVFHGTGSSVRRLSAGICGTVEFGVRPHAHSRIRSWDRSARGICRSAARRILCGPGRIGNSPARIVMVGLDLTIALDRLLHLRLLLLERLRCRSGLGLGEKALLASVLQRGFRCQNDLRERSRSPDGLSRPWWRDASWNKRLRGGVERSPEIPGPVRCEYS